MTIERSSPTGTARYVPSSGGVNLDVFGLSNPAQPSPLRSPSPSPPRIEITRTSNPDIVRVALTFYDLSWGLNATRGYFDELHNKLKTSTLDHSYEEHLILPQLITKATTPDFHNSAAGFYNWLSTATLSRHTAIVVRDGTNGEVCLVRETSVTNPVLEDSTYTPDAGNLITGIWGPFVIGGTAVVLVGRTTDPIDAISDLTATPPTIAATMEASLDAIEAVIETGIPDPHWLFYDSGGRMWGLPSSATLATVPTQIATDMPTPRDALGLIAMGGGPARCYWYVDTGEGADAIGPHGGSIISTNQSGLSPTKFDVPLDTVRQAIKARNGIVSHNGKRMIYQNGRIIRDLLVLADRPADSDLQQSIYGVWAINDWDLYALIIRWRSSASSAGSTQARIEKYDWDRGIWYAASEDLTLSTPSGDIPQGFNNVTGMPYSPANETIHWYLEDGATNTQSWYRMKVMPPGVNPYTRRKTSGASAGTGETFASSGVATSPSMTIRELEGWQFCLRRIIGPPQDNIDAAGTGGTPGKIAIAVADRQGAFNTAWTATFTAGEPAGRRPYHDYRSKQFTYEIAYRVTVTQQSGGTDPTRFTPNCLPFTLVFDARRPPEVTSLEFGDWTA